LKIKREFNHEWTQKTIDRITDVECGQMLNYLRITKLRVGVILNFKHPEPEWERIVL
jgi:GxxExxY protein